ncbi:type II toxin-antitoxin system VapC family toxin [Phaeodactylibacter xiamenensis]|uniref:type II toxin-antitoxin system VapC family toxin n=1 Tax=Phaeodactylibacter xiamenensis TaxID=1524460 RepID=UPI0024AA0294|nr:PIN domain-containing protein [Phaeodactylibacter xiamenensis]
MANKIFIDADVVLDFFTDRSPFANPASEIFELSERGAIQLYLSAASINNIYYIVRKFLGHKNTLQVIEALTEMTEIVGTTEKEILQALKNDFKDFEDSIQYSCAITILGLEAILTRNVKDYARSEIAVLTPEHYLNTIGGDEA